MASLCSVRLTMAWTVGAWKQVALLTGGTKVYFSVCWGGILISNLLKPTGLSWVPNLSWCMKGSVSRIWHVIAWAMGNVSSSHCVAKGIRWRHWCFYFPFIFLCLCRAWTRTNQCKLYPETNCPSTHSGTSFIAESTTGIPCFILHFFHPSSWRHPGLPKN